MTDKHESPWNGRDFLFHRKQTRRQMMILVLFAIFTASCTKLYDAADPPVMKNGMADVIRLEGGDWGYPTPFAHYPRGPGGFKMALIFDSLLERDEKGLVPWLAKSWDISTDGKTYIFTLQRGVIWQDGKPLTPEDVCFSLDYASRHAATWSTVFKTIEKTDVLPGDKIRVRVNEPCATMLYAIGTCRIIPAHIWKDVENPRTFITKDAVIGTGPYRLTDYSKEHGTYRFEAFGAFWGPKPRVRVLEFVPVGEPILAFENGDIDMTGVPPDLVFRYQDKPDLKIVESPAFWGYRLLFNMEKCPVLSHVAVRKSIRYGVDLNELVQKIARGAALPGQAGILPPGHVMYHGTRTTYGHDPVKAVNLLNSQGFHVTDDRGNITPDQGLTIQLLVSTQEVRMAELIKTRLGQVGISLQIISVDGKTRDSRVKDRDYQMAIIGHGGWGQDADYLWSRFKGDNSLSPLASGFSGYRNPVLDVLLDKQHVEMDPHVRRTLVAEIQDILADELPEIALFYGTDYTVYRPGTYNGWMTMYDHHCFSHSKLSYLDRKGFEY